MFWIDFYALMFYDDRHGYYIKSNILKHRAENARVWKYLTFQLANKNIRLE